MITAGKFTAYDVYRADCSRYGFMMTSDQSAGSTSSPHKLSMFGDEMYLEFGEPVLTEKGLPESITSFDGLGVEVHLHLFTALPSGHTNYYQNEYLALGICEERIATDKTISWINRPNPNYFVEGLQVYNNFFVGYDEVTGANLLTGDDSGVEEVVLYSTAMHSPIDVLNAIKDAAITVRSVYTSDVGDYNGNDSVNVYAGGSYAPYVEILYGIVAPDQGKLNASTPSNNAYVNPYAPEKINVQYLCGDRSVTYVKYGKTIVYRAVIGGSAAHSSTTVEFRDALGENTVSVTAQSLSIDIPAEVLEWDEFEWRPTVENIFGATTTAANWKNATTVDSVPITTIDSPKNTYVNVEEAAVFDWTHAVATGTLQSKYDLQVMIGGAWTTLQEEATSETMAVVPAELLSSQITAWRVRTANNDGVYGEYSEAANVILVVAPSVAGLAVTGNVLPTVTWQSADQQGFEVVIDGVSTGVVYGTDKSYAWSELLPDGMHTVQVRVINQYGLYSAWAEVAHEVRNVPPDDVPELTAAALDGTDVRLAWTGAVGTQIHVFRDEERIAVQPLALSSWMDHTATGRHIYFVRAADAAGNYVDSAKVVANVPIRDAVMAADGEWEWIPLRWSSGAEPPVRNAAIASVCALNYYSGRQAPVAEMSAHRSASYSLAYAVTNAQAAALRGMIGKIVVYKRRGELLRGLLQNVSEARSWWGVEVTMQIVEVDES